MFDDELLSMAAYDLKVRQRLLDEGKLTGGYNPEMESVHRRNAARLREIVGEIGWPTISKVGPEASEAAWLIVQHSIGEPELMRASLAMMTAASDDVDPKHIAYLHDRICVFEGRPQRYGTQFDENMRMCPVEDRTEVNRLRRTVGLAEHSDDVILDVHDGSAADDGADRTEYEQWRKKAGWTK